MDDGAFWRQTPQGLVAARIAPGGPAARAGVREGDVLVAVNGEEALSPARLERAARDAPAGRAARATRLLRESERRVLDVQVQPLARGNVERLLLPLARGLLQPRGRHRGAAAAAGRPHGAALLRRVRALLPRVLDLVHRLAHALRLAAVLGRLARGAVPAGRVPALLPRVPRAAPAHAAQPGWCRRCTCRRWS